MELFLVIIVLYYRRSAGRGSVIQLVYIHFMSPSLRHRSGLYTCTGSNTVGDGESNALSLDIKRK